MTRTVLIIEDNPGIGELVRMQVSDLGMQAILIDRGDLGLERFRQGGIDLVILDLMLPGLDGLAVCREIRAKPGYVPVLMLTAKSSELDRVLGLEMGADDYVAKPVKPRVLLARIRALLRRVETDSERDSSPSRLEFGVLVIDNSAREVTLRGQSVDLTSAEYDLLWLLASNAGTVLSRETIFEKLRGIQYDGQDRSIDVRISRIRPKVGDDPENPKRIKTVRSKGYLFVKEMSSG